MKSFNGEGKLVTDTCRLFLSEYLSTDVFEHARLPGCANAIDNWRCSAVSIPAFENVHTYCLVFNKKHYADEQRLHCWQGFCQICIQTCNSEEDKVNTSETGNVSMNGNCPGDRRVIKLATTGKGSMKRRECQSPCAHMHEVRPSTCNAWRKF